MEGKNSRIHNKGSQSIDKVVQLAKSELVLASWPGVCGDIGPIFMIDVLLPYMDCCCSSPIFRMVGRLSVAAAVFH
ncbi:hypothetical protein Tco_0476743, partial [Tanacetum coccineum]